MDHLRDSTENLQLLSELVLVPRPANCAGAQQTLQMESTEPLLPFDLRASTLQTWEDLESLATSNHVILRAFEPLHGMLEAAGNREGADWVADSIQRERARITHALGFLERICEALESARCPVTVIKSLDHWPDLGSDLDLYTDARAADVIKVMSAQFGASLADRSWGDRLANKWNFIVPGLPELVEVHVGRLGQTGEQTAITRSLVNRVHRIQFGSHNLRLAALEDRIVISTLQRMYRHFYIRLCDIADNARLLDSHAVDFEYLRSLGSAAGLWEGIATYLRIVSEYVAAYRGDGVPLPSFVARAAKFGSNQIRFRRQFLRVPILPHSLNLYATELKSLLRNGELRNGLRLSLLPCLATAAAVELKISGSDKGIW